MASVLPREIVVVVEGIVGKDLGVCVGADVAGVVADALPGEAHIGLSPKRNADFRIAAQAEEARWIAGNAVVPTDSREAEANFMVGGREGVDPCSAGKLRWIGIPGRERYWDYGRGEVEARALK